MTRHPRMILLDSILCLLPVFSQVIVTSTSCLRMEPVFLLHPYLFMLKSLSLNEMDQEESSCCLLLQDQCRGKVREEDCTHVEELTILEHASHFSDMQCILLLLLRFVCYASMLTILCIQTKFSQIIL